MFKNTQKKPDLNRPKVSRVKEEGTLASYTNDVKVEIDYRRVDPRLIEEAEEKEQRQQKESKSDILKADV